MSVHGASKQWYEWPAKVKSNLNSILVFVENTPLVYKATFWSINCFRFMINTNVIDEV